MTDQRLKNLTGTGRRTFLKWSATVGALLGLERSRFLDVLSDSAGTAMADDGACGTTARSVHLIAGNGGLAWFTQLFPYIQVAKNADGSTLAFYGTPADVVAAPTDNPSVYGKYSPFQTLGKSMQMTAFVAGVNQTHTQTPSTGLQLGSNGLIAALASIQSANPTLLPVMGVNPVVFGTAPGAPNIATVANAGGLVDLFNSEASKTILAVPADAALNEAYYKAFLNLNAAAARASVAPVYDTARVATNLLGKNLSTQLAVTTADMTRYGVSSSTASNVLEIAQCLITGVKAFKLGLTASVIVPAMRDDPHGAFQNATTLNNTVMTLGKILDAFMADCIATPDPSCQSASLADNIVLTITGDTPKDALNQSGWPDGTASNHNLVYVMGGGWIKTGWHGDLDLQGNISTWDPLTGATVVGGNSANMASPAAAAIAYSVARGDSRRVADFGVTVPTGVTYAQQM
jgi:hypothetical protein